MDEVHDRQLLGDGSWESEVADEERISPYLIGTIVVLLLLILALAGLIIRSVFTSTTAPRSEVERNLLQAQALVRANPQNPLAHYDLGVVYTQMGNDQKGEDEFKRSSKLGPKLADPHYQLGLLYIKRGQEEKGIKELNTALKLAPANAQAGFELGKVYYNRKDYKKAQIFLENATKANAIFADPHYYLGLTYEKLGKKDSAAKEYREALKFIPDYEQAQKGLDRVSK